MRREAIRVCRRAATASEQKIMYTKSKGALYSPQRALYSSERALYSSKRALLSYATGGGCRLFARVKKQWLQAGKQLCNRKNKRALYWLKRTLFFSKRALFWYATGGAWRLFARVKKQWLQAGRQLCKGKTNEPYIDSKEFCILAKELYSHMPPEAEGDE